MEAALGKATVRPVDESRFEDLHRDHEEVLGAARLLEEALRGEAASETCGGRGALLAALEGFLELCQRVLEPHMAVEEREVYPLLDRYLPPDVGSAEGMLREHETLRGLVALLRRGHDRLSRGAAEAESDVVTTAEDLVLLLREHIRKEEGVIQPLLRRLMGASRG